MAYGLTFVIHPENQELSLGLFQKTIEDVHRLIRDVDYALTRERGPRRWVVQELHSSTPTITLRPLLENEELVEAIVNGVHIVSQGSLEPPAHFGEDALDDLIRMRRLFSGRDRVKRIEFCRNGHVGVAERDIVDKAKKILKGGYWALGSIEGTLEAVNFHGNPTFTIWDRVSRAPIRCYFYKERDWKDRVKGLLEKRVLVRGKVNYFRNGLPRSIANIQEIEDMTPSPGLPKATFGSIPSKEAAEDVVSFLRSVREGR